MRRVVKEAVENELHPTEGKEGRTERKKEVSLERKVTSFDSTFLYTVPF
jgi:hypothetical protein